MYWLIALWMSSCSVNGTFEPCTATSIIAGPISEAECMAQKSAHAPELAAYSCARFGKDDRYKLRADLPASPIDSDGGNAGRYQLRGNEKIYE